MAEKGRWKTIEEVRAEAVVCCRCDLCYSRTHVVFGKGPPNARVMMVGEGPGEEEDKQAAPFVGQAGKCLDKLLSEVGLDRGEIWLTNIVRCRPVTRRDGSLRNRAPRADEIRACDIWMNAEYGFVSPEAVVCLGGVPAQVLVSRAFRIGEGRGRWHPGREGVPTTATYHPAYVLRLRGRDRERIEARMVADLRAVKTHLAGEREEARCESGARPDFELTG